MPLALIHRSLPASRPFPASATAWRTCLREVLFLDDESLAMAASDADTVATDADAYALLVEIVSGLRSPLIGETEVQAQFKSFLATLDSPSQHWVRVIGQRVLTDAKQIRQRHLQGVGAHSYGRLVAPYLTSPRVVVIGTGALACEVLGAMPSGTPGDIWGRSEEKRPRDLAPHLRYRLIAESDRYEVVDGEAVTVAVAAPVSAADLSRVTACYATITAILDLRGADQQTPIEGDAPVITLADLFAHVRDASGRSDAHTRVRAARADIREQARAYAAREELRPFGWDDLCA